MTVTLRTGVVGVGHLGRFHAQKYAVASQLQGVYDANPTRAAEVAAELGCRSFTRLEALLEAVDAISVVTPTSTHHAVTTQALEAGVHCLVEKPFTLDLAEADQLQQLAQAQGLVLAVGHIERAQPIMEYLRAQDFGAPRYIEAERLAPFKPRSLDVDVIMDLMIHDLDLALMLTGSRPTTVQAVGVDAVTDQADMANAWLRLENGAVASLAASRVVREPVRRMRIFWEDRYASLDFSENRLLLYRKGQGAVPGIPGVREERIELPKADALEAEIRAFLGAVTGAGTVICDAAAGRAALAAALAVRDAVQEFLHHRPRTVSTQGGYTS